MVWKIGWYKCRYPLQYPTLSQQSRVRASSVFSSRARAAPGVKGPPEPIAIRSFSGWMTSPLRWDDERCSFICDGQQRFGCAAHGRYASLFAVQQQLSPVTGFAFSSLRSNSFKQRECIRSPPAKPAMTLSLYRRRTFFTLPFITVLPVWPDHHRRLPYGRYGVRLLLLSRADPFGYKMHCTGPATNVRGVMRKV